MGPLSPIRRARPCSDPPVFLDEIRAGRSTIVFTNSRGLCERLAQRLNELADEELVRAHHGSVSHEKRTEIEEGLFLRGVHPLRTLGQMEDGALAAMSSTAAELLRSNLRSGRRVTRFEGNGGLWVYGRRGRPCHRCGTPVSLARLGRDARDTYWCPRCQPVRR